MATTIALLGAGGKMGGRITDQLEGDPAYEMRYVESAEEGRERLRERGVESMPLEAALDGAEIAIMAVPDELIGDICDEVVPHLDVGAMVMLLDPAAAYAGVLPEREDIAYFITHPCHPPLFHDESDPEARADLFGGQNLARQNIVCALHRGSEADYDRGEAIARDIYAPVIEAHRVTTEQMAILEPALVETLSATLISVIHRGMERAVEMGVPEEAAFDFLMGHIRIEVAIFFGVADFPFSNAAQHAIEEAMDELFVDDWENRVFDIENVQDSVDHIASTE